MRISNANKCKKTEPHMDFWGEQCPSVKSRVGLAHLDIASAEGRDPKATALGAYIWGLRNAV